MVKTLVNETGTMMETIMLEKMNDVPFEISDYEGKIHTFKGKLILSYQCYKLYYTEQESFVLFDTDSQAVFTAQNLFSLFEAFYQQMSIGMFR